jgi:hypothetical protein
MARDCWLGGDWCGAQATRQLLPGQRWETRGEGIEVKGKGVMQVGWADMILITQRYCWVSTVKVKGKGIRCGPVMDPVLFHRYHCSFLPLVMGGRASSLASCVLTPFLQTSWWVGSASAEL